MPKQIQIDSNLIKRNYFLLFENDSIIGVALILDMSDALKKAFRFNINRLSKKNLLEQFPSQIVYSFKYINIPAYNDKSELSQRIRIQFLGYFKDSKRNGNTKRGSFYSRELFISQRGVNWVYLLSKDVKKKINFKDTEFKQESEDIKLRAETYAELVPESIWIDSLTDENIIVKQIEKLTDTDFIIFKKIKPKSVSVDTSIEDEKDYVELPKEYRLNIIDFISKFRIKTSKKYVAVTPEIAEKRLEEFVNSVFTDMIKKSPGSYIKFFGDDNYIVHLPKVEYLLSLNSNVKGRLGSFRSIGAYSVKIAHELLNEVIFED